MVASCGASMPAPLAIPPTIAPEGVVTSAVLGTESVVMIAREAAASASGPAVSCPAAVVTPASSGSIGRRSPISPVEQTSTSWAATSSRSARCSAVRWVSAKPSGPVHAFAPPEFRTTARARPSETAWRDQRTGAAWTRLRVNTAAAVSRGPSLRMRERSSLPVALMPAARPTARKPRGRVIDMGAPERSGRCCGGSGAGTGRSSGDGSYGARAQGASAVRVRPVPSGSPSARFMDWIAAPAVPLTRLSSAEITVAWPL